MVLLILAIMVGILIGAVVFFVLWARDDKLKDDLVYGVRYANAFIKRGDNAYHLTIFDGSGILEQRAGVNEEEIHAMRLNGDWRLAAERYSTEAGGKTLQLEQRVSKP